MSHLVRADSVMTHVSEVNYFMFFMHSLTECESRVVRRPGAERSARVRSGAKSFGARRVHASVPAHAGAHERDLGFPARGWFLGG